MSPVPPPGLAPARAACVPCQNAFRVAIYLRVFTVAKRTLRGARSTHRPVSASQLPAPGHFRAPGEEPGTQQLRLLVPGLPPSVATALPPLGTSCAWNLVIRGLLRPAWFAERHALGSPVWPVCARAPALFRAEYYSTVRSGRGPLLPPLLRGFGLSPPSGRWE